MKGYAITHLGCEPFCAAEIEEHGGTEIELLPEVVLFTVPDLQALARLLYTGQTFGRLGIFLCAVAYTQDWQQALEQLINSLPLEPYCKDAESFRVLVHSRLGIDRQEWEAHAGELVLQRFPGLEGKVSLDHPAVTIAIHASQDRIIAGIDLAGRDLSKRSYKIMNYAASLKGTLASCILRFADVQPKDVILDPWSGTGEIPIEAALRFSKTSPHRFHRQFAPLLETADFRKLFDSLDAEAGEATISIQATDPQLRFVEALKKNAKIAGIEKHIQVSRADIDWLDTKFAEKSVDKVITHAPTPSKHMPAAQATRLNKELFYQMEFILKPQGTVTLLCSDAAFIRKIAEEKSFKVLKLTQVHAGQQAYDLLQLGQ